MFQWTEKIQPQQDWITVLIILIFTLSVFLFKRNPHQFKLLVYFWRSKSYFNIYDKERYIQPLTYVQLNFDIHNIDYRLAFELFFLRKNLIFIIGGDLISIISFGHLGSGCFSLWTTQTHFSVLKSFGTLPTNRFQKYQFLLNDQPLCSIPFFGLSLRFS